MVTGAYQPELAPVDGDGLSSESAPMITKLECRFLVCVVLWLVALFSRPAAGDELVDFRRFVGRRLVVNQPIYIVPGEAMAQYAGFGPGDGTCYLARNFGPSSASTTIQPGTLFTITSGRYGTTRRSAFLDLTAPGQSYPDFNIMISIWNRPQFPNVTSWDLESCISFL